MNDQAEEFIDELQKSLQDTTFVKLSLGNYKGADKHLQKVLVRLVDSRKGQRLSFRSRYEKRDVDKNFDLEEGVITAQKYLESGFRSGHLFTTEFDLQLKIGKRSAFLIRKNPTFKTAPSTFHDREKKYVVDQNASYLKALGITTENGLVRNDQRDKWVQINKFVEILEGLIRNSSLRDKKELRIVDMGSGKGYLTFALYDHLRQNHLRQRVGSSQLFIVGVEQRPELVKLCNDLAKTCGFDGLHFKQGTIAYTEIVDVDILIALHACDTATDDAIYKGIMANANIIVVAPCCHHEIKKQLRPPELLTPILKHRMMHERISETITDGIRSMLLESRGYKTKMFEFVATEHTPKNNLLVATLVRSPHASKGSRARNESVSPKRANGRTKIDALISEFGLQHQRLYDLLNNEE